MQKIGSPACDYLLKPIEENALNSAIEKALHRNQLQNP